MIRIIKEFMYRNNKRDLLLQIIMIVSAGMPLYKQAIMCNDELQARYWGMQGYFTAQNYYFHEMLSKGRALSAPIVSISLPLGFLGESNYVFRIMQIVTLILVSLLFGYAVALLLENVNLGRLCAISSFVFLPITFEHTEPNAFVTDYCVPMILFYGAVILFIKYLNDKSKKRYIYIFSILLFIALTSYEAFVTLSPVFILILLYKSGLRGLKNNIGVILIIMADCFVFLGMYLLLGKLFPSNYEGNQITAINIGESLKIIIHLFKACFPGYFLFSPKYKSIWNVYKYFSVDYFVRAGILAVVFFAFFYDVMSSLSNDKLCIKKIKHFFVLIGALFVIICTSLPISIAKMYQGNVGEQGFIALPVTYFAFPFAVFVIIYILYIFINLINYKSIRIVMSLCMSILLFAISYQNDIYAEVNNENFMRLCRIESVIESRTMDKCTGLSFYAPNIYETRNALAIHDGYWTSFAEIKDVDVSFNVSDVQSDNRIYADDDCEQFQIWKDNKLSVMSSKCLEKSIPVRYDEFKCFSANCIDHTRDHGWFCYYFKLINNELMPISAEEF